MRKSLIVFALCLITTKALAGPFHVHEFGPDLGTSISNLVKGIVTDEFTSAFPPDKYTIVVIYEHFRLGDDNICSAVAGVTQQKKKGDLTAQVPLWRFSAQRIDRNSGSWNVAKTRGCQVDVIRSAVDSMMSITPKELKEKSHL